MLSPTEELNPSPDTILSHSVIVATVIWEIEQAGKEAQIGPTGPLNHLFVPDSIHSQQWVEWLPLFLPTFSWYDLNW